jgi:hypothetical protein
MTDSRRGGHNAASLLGHRYSRLTVLKDCGSTDNGKKLWLCACECGSTCVAPTGALRSGNTKSCGCLNRERAAERIRERMVTHGLSGHPLYTTWAHMVRRCVDADDPNFHNYGGRGIAVCDRWLRGEMGMDGIECFIADMGPRPTRFHSIDRRNNDGNYEPDNCRWATKREQNRNKRSNKLVELDGEILCLKDACTLAGANYSSVQFRLSRGLSFDDAVKKGARS